MATEDISSSINLNNNIDWTVQNEVQLLLALMGHKPVGVAKHFHMACILEKFSSAVKRVDISSQVIWDRLDTMYDLQALEETEALPFPNDPEDFSLPHSQYGQLLAERKSVKMPPPRAPSPPPESNKKEDPKDSKKEPGKEIPLRKELKETTKKAEDKKVNIRDSKKDNKEETKRDKRLSKDSVEAKKDKESAKGKELVSKELRLPKRASIVRDDEDSSVSSTGSTKKSRENSDTDDAVSTPKRGPNSSANNQSANGKGKRQTRLSHAKVSDDSGSNKSISPLTVSSPATKRRRQV